VDQLVTDVEKYLMEVTGTKITIEPMNEGDLSYFYIRQYDLYRLNIGNAQFSAAFLLQEDEFTPAQFIKHMQKLPYMELERTCVVAQSLPSYVRKRLIEKGISFVIPYVQMYLPLLGMALRSRYSGKKVSTVERLSPATQVVLISWLIGKIQNLITPLELSKHLFYSAMSMSRALDELETTQIAQAGKQGRERFVSFPEDKKNTWEEALLRLRNPISKKVRVHEYDVNKKNVLLAGITALSTRSMISEPKQAEYALSRDSWKTMVKKGIEEIPVNEPGTCVLQIWCYDPKVLEVKGHVDPFSLYLSLYDEVDERIEMALEEMMEQFLW